MLLKPKLLRRIHGKFVVNAGVTDDRLEAPAMRGDPVRQIPAVRAARRSHSRTIDEFVFRQRHVHARHHVRIRFAAPIVGNLVCKFLPIPG